VAEGIWVQYGIDESTRRRMELFWSESENSMLVFAEYRHPAVAASGRSCVV